VSDNRSGLPHDLPEYEPNVPLAIKVTKARVYKDATFLGDPCWRWEHACAYRGRALKYGYPEASQPAALAGALKHMEHCL